MLHGPRPSLAFCDGKECAGGHGEVFKPGDFYSGYYRDPGPLLSSGAASVKEFFAQLYAAPIQATIRTAVDGR